MTVCRYGEKDTHTEVRPGTEEMCPHSSVGLLLAAAVLSPQDTNTRNIPFHISCIVKCIKNVQCIYMCMENKTTCGYKHERQG